MKALLVVDVQNDFVTGSLPVPRAHEIIPLINELAGQFRASGDRTVFSQDWHPDVTPHFDRWPAHCVTGTDGARLHAGLDVDASDVLVRKGLQDRDGYSVFEAQVHDVPFAQWLRDAQVDELHVCGLATDYCVLQTVLDARHAGVKTVVHLGACRAVNLRASDESDAIAQMRRAGADVG